MSGFSTEWLDLREHADHAARDAGLLAAAAAFLDARADALAVDLGCGTGSTVRAFGSRLTSPARWRLVDNDPVLLAAALERLPPSGIAYAEADLRDIDALPIEGAALVTASALFDLVSLEWLRRFATRLERGGTGLYAALNYDGRLEFADPHPMDGAVGAAFNEHQRTDKGFGSALGPGSPAALRDRLSDIGFCVELADSAWELPVGGLQSALVSGIASAVVETGRVNGSDLDDWLAHRRRSPGGAKIGHLDVLALPR